MLMQMQKGDATIQDEAVLRPDVLHLLHHRQLLEEMYRC